MKIILESIKEIISENRVDDIKKKFPNIDPAIIDYFSNVDPSGNNKYLEWMVKAMTHQPTTWEIGSIINDHSWEDGYWGDTAGYISELTTKFHNLLPYMVHMEDGVKQGTTDLYQYKFTDGEMIHYLIHDLDWAAERKRKKEEQKEQKKGADRIYEDSNWLVVRPKTYAASCHYGTGTRWCTTSKESSRHFERETNRNFLIYVINKKKPPTDRLYKVAWQIPNMKNIGDVIDPLSSEVHLNKLKLWDAEDNNIVDDDNPYVPEQYTNSVPFAIKVAMYEYMTNEMSDLAKNTGFNENPKIQALIDHLNLQQEAANSIIESEYTNYGMKIFEVESTGDAYAVATDDEFTMAKEEWAELYIQQHGVSEAIERLGSNYGEYIYFRDKKGLATELTNNYIDDLNDKEILEQVKDIFTFEVYGVYENSLITLKEFDEDFKNLETEYQNEEITKTQYETELANLEEEKKHLKSFLEDRLKYLRSLLWDKVNTDYFYEMDDTVKWLKEYGWWGKNRPDPTVFDKGIINVDMESLTIDLADELEDEYFSSGAPISMVDVGGNIYRIMPTDI